MTNNAVHRAIDAIWRIESARLIGRVARIVRDLDTAEELAHGALVTALERWPADGIPDNPGAWLMQTAKHRAIDVVRRRGMLARKHEQLGHEPPATAAAPDLDDDVGDDLLRLIFVACHPLLSPDARAALTLRLVGGLSIDEIARAFLTPATTIQQRIVRAKRTLAAAGVPFEVPQAQERAARLASVLEVLYLIFNEGYAATAGEDWMRPQLCADALRLARILVGLVPAEPEAHGLVALLELQSSRTQARTGPDGEPVLLLQQNRARWDHLLIRRGLSALARAESLAPTPGPYTLQAAIAACHARARTAEATEWGRIAALYDVLAAQMGSPVVELNRAVAHGMAFGPAVGLALVDALAQEPALARYHLLPSVRGDLLLKLERFDEARVEIERAASLTTNARERAVLLARAAATQQPRPLRAP